MLIDQLFEREGVTRNMVVDCQVMAVVANLISQGVGVGFIDPFTAAKLMEFLSQSAVNPQRRNDLLLFFIASPHPEVRARSLVVHAVTGYWVRFPVEDINGLLLATHVGGVPLSPEHGCPLRLVAPGRRGYTRCR